MKDREEEFAIQSIPIYKRDETTIGIMGWTWTDMIVVAGALFITKYITQNMKATMLVTALAWLYVKKWKDLLPERFFAKFIAYNLERENTFRALGRDTEWASPIIQSKAQSPLVALWEGLTGPPKANPASKARDARRRENLRKRAKGEE